MKDDIIYRHAVIEVMCELMHHWFGGNPKNEIREIKRELEKLPSAQSEQKTGHWIVLDECSNKGVYCSECRKKVFKIDYSNTMKWKNFKFCPNCGADMREKEKWVPIQDPWKGEENE